MFDWIDTHIRRAKLIYPWASSYGLKHLVAYTLRQADLVCDPYLPEAAFKWGMLELGYQPVDWHAVRWCYRLALRTKPLWVVRVFDPPDAIACMLPPLLEGAV